MSEVEVERSATAHPIVTYVSDPDGPVTGLSLELSVFNDTDPADKWLNLTTGAWQDTKDSAPMTEVIPGFYMRPIDVTQAAPGSEILLAESNITAGANGSVGDVIRLVDNNTQIPTLQEIWEAQLVDYPASGGAAEALLGAGGPATPQAVADAVLNNLIAGWENQDGSVGQVLFNLDSQTLRRLLMAALGKLTRYGIAYKSLPCTDIFVGDAEVIRLPIIKDGALADLTGSTIEWAFTEISTGTRLVKVGTISGTPGHAEYTTVPLDGIVDAAGAWRAQATATFPDTTTNASQIGLVTVQAIV